MMTDERRERPDDQMTGAPISLDDVAAMDEMEHEIRRLIAARDDLAERCERLATLAVRVQTYSYAFSEASWNDVVNALVECEQAGDLDAPEETDAS